MCSDIISKSFSNFLHENSKCPQSKAISLTSCVGGGVVVFSKIASSEFLLPIGLTKSYSCPHRKNIFHNNVLHKQHTSASGSIAGGGDAFSHRESGRSNIEILL